MILVAWIVTDEEAAQASAAGFGGVARALEDAGVEVTLREGHIVRLQPVDTEAVARDGLPSVAASFDGLLLRPAAGRLLDAVPLPALARLAADARTRGVLLAMAGALEAPDMPRLAAAGAEMGVIGRALRQDGRLDERRMAAFTGAGAREAVPRSGTRDRIFVRDLLLAMEIGAYAGERGRRQRVRVSVEAEIEPAGPAETMADIVSYDLITDAVTRLAGAGHVELVETFAEALAGELLAEPRIAIVRVRVEKLDLGPGAVGVEIERGRPPP